MTLARIMQGSFGRVVLADIVSAMAPHVHRHCHVLMKAGGHDGSCTVGRTTVPLSDHNAVMINAWEGHYIDPTVAVRPLTILALYIEPEWLSAVTDKPNLASSLRFFGSSKAVMTPHLRSLKRKLIECLGASDAPDQKVAECLVLGMVSALLLRHGCRATPRESGVVDDRIHRALDVIKSCEGNVSDMALVARESGLSRPRFFAHFKSSVGTSPALYANHIRVESAARRLNAQVEPIVDLSLALGFSEQANFTRFFRKHFGMPPGRFRRALKDSGRLIDAPASAAMP